MGSSISRRVRNASFRDQHRVVESGDDCLRHLAVEPDTPDIESMSPLQPASQLVPTRAAL
ncbi:hypothetical protein CUJ89_37495 [Burkholderia pyrrocinia]|uniref:Uncharacterized protein n=1 Tax=Burkholderia pyrrocinia TaxID=60550 RepID=A0A2Z5N8W5_BURPY|nr:hypothetical protein CUJ89_37495 [Burkholderia pyrrocinia]